MPGHRQAFAALRSRASGGGGRARPRYRRPDLRLCQIHPRQQPRSAPRAQARHGREADRSSQHPWAALLQLGETICSNIPPSISFTRLAFRGWPRRSSKSPPTGKRTRSAITNGSRFSWIAKPPGGKTSGSPPGCARQTAEPGLCRGYRLSQSPRSRPPPVPKAGRGQVDRRSRQSGPDRADRRREKLVGLGARPSGLSGQSIRSLPARARLFEELALARGDGRYLRLLRSLGRVDLLILDDWGLEPLDAAARHDLLEIFEERYSRRSTVITSSFPRSLARAYR